MIMLLSNLASDFMSYLILMVHVSHMLLVLFLLKCGINAFVLVHLLQ